MTVRQLLAQIDSAELTEWMAFAGIEPFGEVAADQRHGLAVSVLANINRDPKKRPAPYVPRDFIPWAEQAQVSDGPELLADPEAQSRLIKQKLFKHG